MKKPRPRHRKLPWKEGPYNRRQRRRMKMDEGPSAHLSTWRDHIFDQFCDEDIREAKARHLRTVQGPMPINAYSQKLRGIDQYLERIDWMADRAKKHHDSFNEYTVSLQFTFDMFNRLSFEVVWLYSDDLWMTPQSIFLADRLRHYTRYHDRSFLELFPFIEEKVGAPVLAYRLVQTARSHFGHRVDLEVAFADETDAMMARLSA